MLKLLIERLFHLGEYKTDIPFSGHLQKIVIFCQKPNTVALIESQILHDYTLCYFKLSSDLSAEARMNVVDSFQHCNENAIMLATTGIGGHGFTLTSANVVIMVEHNMNPFVDFQAIDRTHRIGQNQTVTVYRLVSDEPNEMRIMK